MTEHYPEGRFPRGETSSSPQRPAQRLAASVLTFDLAALLEQVRHEASWERGDHNAMTLVKEPDFRIVLVAMKTDARIQEHHAAGRISIQTLGGRVRLKLPDQTIELPTGHLLALEAGIPHTVEALEPSAFLLTISWPAGRSATD
ncbi:MAG TPA: cupin domain-containing protein [Chloroflexota bacterium]|jgi:quercetin dioxygenase-like cupin family protein|nr:cupin domain-containing protein [Gemmatimonadales bacterium]HZU05721.1 cupin domain-containing protein [Chloroflexota bacterium]